MYKTEFNRAFPKVKFKQKKYIKHEPWMTEGLLVSMRNKSKLLVKNIENQQNRTKKDKKRNEVSIFQKYA